MATVYKFHAEMSCSSCSNRIKKVLEKNRSKGISAFEVDLEKKLVTVTGTITKQEITEILAKTGINIDLLEERPQE